jgi:inorganic pyrophosphatase
MALKLVSPGREIPNDINVVIEIPMHANPIKYEVDKETGAIFVDRFISTAMHYPVNYGYIPQTLGGDGDPLDVLVPAPFPLQPGVVVRCRPVGFLNMEDDGGDDTKLLAVPVDKLTPIYRTVQSPRDLPQLLIDQITHFFSHYKDLEPGKFVKIRGWGEAADARRIIQEGVAAYQG